MIAKSYCFCLTLAGAAEEDRGRTAIVDLSFCFYVDEAHQICRCPVWKYREKAEEDAMISIANCFREKKTTKNPCSASSVYVFSTIRGARAAMEVGWLIFWSEHGPQPSVFCRYMKTDDVLEKQVNSLARTFIHTQSS